MTQSAQPKSAQPKSAQPKSAQPLSAKRPAKLQTGAPKRVAPATATPHLNSQSNLQANPQAKTASAQPVQTTHQSQTVTAPDESPMESGRSTGSPLLDSFLTNTAEEVVFIPNQHITGNPLGNRGQTRFTNVGLPNTPQPTQARPAAGVNSTRQKTKSLAGPLNKGNNHPPTNQQVIPAVPQDRTATNRTNSPQSKAEQSKASSRARNTAHGKVPKTSTHQVNSRKPTPQSAQPTGADQHRRQPVRRQPVGNTQRPNPNARQGAMAAAPGPNKVYSGSSYKALQARAAAGGLVDLEDTLLFGGADNKNGSAGLSKAPLDPENGITVVLEYLSTQPSGFTLTKPEGTEAILDDFSELERPDQRPVVAVIDARKFEVVEPEVKKAHITQSPQSATAETAEIKGLTQKIDQLHDRIEYLSKKLAALDETSPDEDDGVTSSAELSSEDNDMFYDQMILDAFKLDEKEPNDMTIKTLANPQEVL